MPGGCLLFLAAVVAIAFHRHRGPGTAVSGLLMFDLNFSRVGIRCDYHGFFKPHMVRGKTMFRVATAADSVQQIGRETLAPF
jgi:hypothetical protein